MKSSINIFGKIKPFNKIIEIEGDKSLSIRWALLASQASGKSKAVNLLRSEDVISTLNCLKKLGVRVQLKKKDCENLIINSKKVLLSAIKKGGSSIKNFKDISGKNGDYQRGFKVYEREGLICKKFKCQGIIKKKVISNRSTFFCNICQK